MKADSRSALGAATARFSHASAASGASFDRPDEKRSEPAWTAEIRSMHQRLNEEG